MKTCKFSFHSNTNVVWGGSKINLTSSPFFLKIRQYYAKIPNLKIANYESVLLLSNATTNWSDLPYAQASESSSSSCFYCFGPHFAKAKILSLNFLSFQLAYHLGSTQAFIKYNYINSNTKNLKYEGLYNCFA